MRIKNNERLWMAVAFSVLSVNVSATSTGEAVLSTDTTSTVTQDNTQSEVWITSGKQTIFGVLSKPQKTDERQPIVIISHGLNGTHHYGKNYFERINAMGYQCFTFDFPCGSVHSQSDNNTMNMSIIDEQQALEAVVNHFKQQPDIDASRIVLIGESQGGLISSLVAANTSTNIHKLILVYPALCIPDNWNERYRQIEQIPDTTVLWKTKLGRRFFTEIRYLRPFDIIGNFDRQVLIIHGDADKVVPVDYSRRATGIYKHAQLHVIPGAGHGFRPDEFDEEMKAVEEFLKH